jgi:hypothetical protein
MGSLDVKPKHVSRGRLLSQLEFPGAISAYPPNAMKIVALGAG